MWQDNIITVQLKVSNLFQGSHIFQKLRPVDQLRHLLVSCAGGESEEIERFFKLHRVKSQWQSLCNVL